MMVPLLCLVCLSLLGWVIVLKLEIEQLKQSRRGPGAAPAGTRAPDGTYGTAKGMRRYHIG